MLICVACKKPGAVAVFLCRGKLTFGHVFEKLLKLTYPMLPWWHFQFLSIGYLEFLFTFLSHMCLENMDGFQIIKSVKSHALSLISACFCELCKCHIVSKNKSTWFRLL